MANIPLKVRALRSEGVLEIEWSPLKTVRYPFHFLRCECPCASCVNEFTGERTLDPTTVPENVAPTAMEYSGNYAIKIFWSDNHSSGLYSWDHLDRMNPDARSLTN